MKYNQSLAWFVHYWNASKLLTRTPFGFIWTADVFVATRCESKAAAIALKDEWELWTKDRRRNNIYDEASGGAVDAAQFTIKYETV